MKTTFDIYGTKFERNDLRKFLFDEKVMVTIEELSKNERGEDVHITKIEHATGYFYRTSSCDENKVYKIASFPQEVLKFLWKNYEKKWLQEQLKQF